MSRLRVARWRVLAQVLLIFTLLASGLVTPHPLAHADTQVGGPIISDTTWTLANSPYVVVDNVDVWEGVTLTIEPGVMIRFDSGKKMQINGTLVAQGTVSAGITFTSNQSSPQPGDWSNIEFTDISTDATYDGYGNYTGGCVLQHCVVEYGGNDVMGAIETSDASPFIDHCTVQSNDSSGIYALGTDASPFTISNNIVSGNGDRGPWLPTENGGGIYARNSTVAGNAVSDNYAFSGGGGIYVDHAIVMENTVTGNLTSRVGGGICVASYSTATLTANTVAGNLANDGGGIGIAYHAAATIEDNSVVGNSADRLGGGIYGDYSTALIADNTIEDNSAGYKGGGVYTYHGTVQVAENTITGNTAEDEGGGIQAWAGTAVISNTIAGNNILTGGHGSGLHFCGTEDLMHNTIVGNSSIVSQSTTGGVEIASDCGSPAFHYNNLYDNSPYDVTIRSSNDVSGTLNFWGTTSGLGILEQVYDWHDDSSRGKLLYIPYLQDPDPDAPVPPPLNLTADWHDGWVSLEWDPVPSTTTGYGYKAYYDSDSSGPPYDGTGLTEGDSPIDVGDLTEFVLHGLEEETAYYVTITAYESLGREGWYSNEVNNLATLMDYVYLPLVLRGH